MIKIFAEIYLLKWKEQTKNVVFLDEDDEISQMSNWFVEKLSK